ncbi:hypothetical protein L0520_06965 [Vreelandella venusta]|nr:hypothetical protein [Halomonas venusta]WAM53423.1 hypothetical protein L0520_06965 [Halomonas venusta]
MFVEDHPACLLQRHHHQPRDTVVLLTVPHLTTLASFVSRHVDEIEALSEQVPMVC